MPNLKNAKKKVKVISTKNESNNQYKSSMKTAIKNVLKAIKTSDKSKAKEELNVAVTKIDKATKKGVIHSNKGARNKSRLTKQVNSME